MKLNLIELFAVIHSQGIQQRERSAAMGEIFDRKAQQDGDRTLAIFFHRIAVVVDQTRFMSNY